LSILFSRLILFNMYWFIGEYSEIEANISFYSLR